jgi:hypothetical protein
MQRPFALYPFRVSFSTPFCKLDVSHIFCWTQGEARGFFTGMHSLGQEGFRAFPCAHFVMGCQFLTGKVCGYGGRVAHLVVLT